MIATPIFLLLSLLLVAMVLLFTLASYRMLIPRYRTSASQAPDRAPSHFGARSVKEPPAAEKGPITDADLDAIDLPAHLGGLPTTEEMAKRVKEEAIAAQYLVSYAKRVYLNQLFRLRVAISTKATPLSAEEEQREAAHGPLRFIHRWFQETDEQPSPQPDMRVALTYDAAEFRVLDPVKTKPLPDADEVTFDFAVKPLKSEDSALTVEIAYVGSKWQPRQVTMIEFTEENGRTSKTEKVTPAGIVEDIVVLAYEELTIETKSFLNMNAASLNIFTKAAAVALTVIYVGAVVGFGLTEDTTTTLIVGFGSVVSALGIPVAGGVWTNAQVKQGKAVVG
jgi:hypothetical protein